MSAAGSASNGATCSGMTARTVVISNLNRLTRIAVIGSNPPLDSVQAEGQWVGKDHERLEIIGDAEPSNRREPGNISLDFSDTTSTI